MISLEQLFNVASTHSGLLVILLFALATVIQIVPIKIDPWSWLGNQFNKALSAKLDKVDDRLGKVDVRLDSMEARLDSMESKIEFMDSQLNSVDERLDTHIKESDESRLESKRKAILDFASSVIRGINFHREKFEFMIGLCDEYQQYCREHEVINGVADASISEIRRIYQEKLHSNDFLTEKEQPASLV